MRSEGLEIAAEEQVLPLASAAGKTEEDFKRLRIKQINNQVYIKLKDEEIL